MKYVYMYICSLRKALQATSWYFVFMNSLGTIHFENMIQKNFNGFEISILIYCIVKMLSRFNFKWEAEPAAKETDETDSKSKEKPKKKKSRLEKALNEKLSE